MRRFTLPRGRNRCLLEYDARTPSLRSVAQGRPPPPPLSSEALSLKTWCNGGDRWPLQASLEPPQSGQGLQGRFAPPAPPPSPVVFVVKGTPHALVAPVARRKMPLGGSIACAPPLAWIFCLLPFFFFYLFPPTFFFLCPPGSIFECLRRRVGFHGRQGQLPLFRLVGRPILDLTAEGQLHNDTERLCASFAHPSRFWRDQTNKDPRNGGGGASYVPASDDEGRPNRSRPLAVDL